MPWGTHNIDTSSKKLYDAIRERRGDLFPEQRFLFQIAAAVGIKEGKRKELEGETHTLLKSSQDFDPHDVLKSLMEEKYPDKKEKNQLEILEEYAEAGIEIIHEKIKKTGTFDIESYLD